MSKLQRRARVRNFNKFRLVGLHATVRNMAHYDEFTTNERAHFKHAAANLATVLKDWDGNSRELGFKPRKKKEQHDKT